ncbi:hypothetical protein A3Q56_03408 [Intoshia linei]|uniref:WD repeat-containing protein 4 homolog n=1 Tax=Intoshia linei TaxID=1819745 RepID=A0A177B3M2_9BILA|nr:hypothetical protein A3Q56_03408 [Intoshia linei]
MKRKILQLDQVFYIANNLQLSKIKKDKNGNLETNETCNIDQLVDCKEASVLSIHSLKNLILVLLSNRYICVFDISPFGFKFFEKIDKRVSALTTSNVHKVILVGDKHGCVYPIQIKDGKFEPEFEYPICGHILAITEMIFCGEKDRFLATAAEDAKIRIHFYPNCFEIYKIFNLNDVCDSMYYSNSLLVSVTRDDIMHSWNIKDCKLLKKEKLDNFKSNGENLYRKESNYEIYPNLSSKDAFIVQSRIAPKEIFLYYIDSCLNFQLLKKTTIENELVGLTIDVNAFICIENQNSTNYLLTNLNDDILDLINKYRVPRPS